MFCGNCGKQVDPNAYGCPNCGANPKVSINFCGNCGHAAAPNAVMCVNCGCQLKYAKPAGTNRLLVGLLAIFVGTLGVHNFILGYTGKAVAQLLLTLVGWVVFGLGPVAAWIWALVEGIQILSSKINVDAKGVPLID